MKAELLSSSTDWDQTSLEIKELQNQWKTIGPVPRKVNNELWNRFRSACDAFFDARKPHMEQRMMERKENLKQKEKLLVEAEALVGATDWQETANKFKRLQSEWKMY